MTGQAETIPPYTITSPILDLIERIGEAIGRAEEAPSQADLQLRRANRIRSIRGSLAIEGNTLIEEQLSTILDGNPVESLVYERQSEYYGAIREGSNKGESTPFIVFMLEAILEAVISTPQEKPQSSPQVERLPAVLEGEMSLRQILHAIGLSNRKSFRQRYLLPALEHGCVEMTLPESPAARNQRYRTTASGKTAA